MAEVTQPTEAKPATGRVAFFSILIMMAMIAYMVFVWGANGTISQKNRGHDVSQTSERATACRGEK